MLKVAWLPFWPNKNIYSPIFNSLGKSDKEIDAYMIVPAHAKSYDAGNKYFRMKYLPSVEYKKFFFLDYLKKKAKKEEIDVVTTMRLKGLSKELASEKPNVVVSNMEYSLYTIQCALYCKRTKTPLIVQTETKIVTGFRLTLYKIYMKAFFMLFRKVMPCMTAWSNDSQVFMQKNFPGLTKYHFLPPGVDTKKFKYKKKATSKVLKVLVASRFAPYKRHEDILEAAALVKDLKIQFNLLGNGPTKERIVAQVKEMGLSKTVKFMAPVKFESMDKAYQDADLLIHASYNEAIGMVVPEAMACGTPVIVSDTTGAASYVEDGINGLVFRTADPQDLASKIREMADAKRRLEMGKHASEHIAKYYSVEAIAEKFHKIIRSASF